MKSLCIKSNNSNIIAHLQKKLSDSELDSLYISNYRFKVYENLIVHYTSNTIDLFYDKFSSILTDCIILFYQNKLLKRILSYNYFYFNSDEKNKILEIAEDFIDNDSISYEDNFFSIYYSIVNFIKSNKSIVLDGFVNFRLQNYMKNLDYIIDISVNKFLIEKEYREFVDILKLYISMTPFKSSKVHLIYYNDKSILLDDKHNVIPIEDELFKAKYLSDISFSSNDYALNTILNLTPKKLIIHLIDSQKKDEFINTLKLIFENRCEICTDCKICSAYKISLSLK